MSSETKWTKGPLSLELYEALAAAREYIMSEAEKRNYDPPVPTALVADMDTSLASARGEG